MAADANIFAQYLRPVKSMQDYGNDMNAAEQNRLTLQAGRMKAQQDQQGFADENTFRGLAQQYGTDQNALYKAAMAAGLVGKAQGVRKSMTDQAQADANLGKTGAETDEKRFKLAKERRDAYEQARGGLERDPALTKDKVVGVISGMVDYGMMPAELAQKLTANLPDDPEALRADIRSGNLSRLTPEQMVTLFTPKFEYQDSGQQRVPVQTNMNVPGAVAPPTIQKVATPGEVMRSDDAAKSRAQSAAQHSQTLGLQRDKFNADQGTAVADAGGPTQAPLVKKFGKAEAGTRWKADGTLEFIPGGSKDPKNNAGVTTKVTDAQDVLSLLDQAGPLVEKATGSYAGYGADQAARVVGQSTEGSRAAAQLKVLEGSLISKMPKMSGPQSDKDVLLYKQMAGQIGDPTIPKDQKVAAMQTIREINERHAGGAAKPAVRTPVRTGKLNGRKVIEYSDGTTAYAD